MDHPISRVPDAPHLHLALTVGTPERIAPRALRIALPIGQTGDDLHRTLDHALDLSQRRLDQLLELGKRLGGLHPVRADAFKPFGQRVLHHATTQRGDGDSVLRHPGGAVGAVMLGHPHTIIAINAPDGAGRADDILGHVACHAVGLRGDSPLVHVGHQPVGILLETRIAQAMDGVGLACLAQHGEEVPLPLAAQEPIRQVREVLPARAPS